MAFVDFAWWHTPVDAYDSQKKATQARNRHDDESVEREGSIGKKKKACN
jgi:hypothetical protein